MANVPYLLVLFMTMTRWGAGVGHMSEGCGGESQLHGPSALGREVLGLLPALVQPPFTGAVWTLPTHVASLATWHASLGLCDSDSATNTLCGAGQLIRPLWSKSFPPSAEASCSPDLLRSSINFHSPSFRVGIPPEPIT